MFTSQSTALTESIARLQAGRSELATLKQPLLQYATIGPEQLEAVLLASKTTVSVATQVVAAADELWRSVNEAVSEVAQRWASEIDAELLPGQEAAELRGAFAIVPATFADLRQGMMEGAARVLEERGLFTPDQFRKAGELIKAFVTDQMPLYGTLTKLIELITGEDLDRRFWESLAEPARRELALQVFFRTEVVAIIATLVADMARIAQESAVEILSSNDA